MPRSLRSLASASLACGALLASLPGLAAQDWTDDELQAQAKVFLELKPSLLGSLQQVAKLLANQQQAYSAIVARIHGDHREYNLKVDRLLSELSDERWTVREEAERTLVEIGGRAKSLIQQRAEKPKTPEEQIRCKRVFELLNAKGTEQEDRETNLLKGLVSTTLYLPPDPRMLRALRSALGHTDSVVVDGAIRALGKHGTDEEAMPVKQMLAWKGGIHRTTTLHALARMPSAKALEICRELLAGKELTRGEAVAMVRNLRMRTDAQSALAAAASSGDPVVAAAAKLPMPEPAPGANGPKVRFTLPDAARSALEATFRGFLGDATLAQGAIEGIDVLELSFGDSDVLDFPDTVVARGPGARVFLNQGSLVTGELRGIDPTGVKIRSPVFGELTLPRTEVQGIVVDPELERLVGASVEFDRVRLKSNEFVDGKLIRVTADTVVIEPKDGGSRELALKDVAGLLLTRPRVVEPDSTIYTRFDLANGDKLIGFLAASTPTHVGVAVPMLGAAVVPADQLVHLELAVGGGAMWGFTLAADYSDNKIIEVDDQHRLTFEVTEVFGAWDAECLDNGNLLITEFSVSRVQEVDRKGKQIWVFEDLKNPYDADRLPNGNTLIADTFGSRVIEVSPQGQIVWKFDKDVRPFDTERLANGNTLIADVLKDRVIEVSPEGEVVWEVKGMNNVHDADRLPNGNTLITLRSKGAVIEVDREGRTVWELKDLGSPSDADRLPNGHTIVAENNQVREFDRRGNVVWKHEMTWAVEVNRY